jgi:O-antigen ligase
MFVRFLLYFLFLAVETNVIFNVCLRKLILQILTLEIVFISILGTFQFVRQSAIFNNYLFFGEQPYSTSTPYIAKESYAGVSRIPPYATFLHPNILAGFLVVLLTFLVGSIAVTNKGQPLIHLRNLSYASAGILGTFALILTKSYTAWLAFILGILLLFSLTVLKVKVVGRWLLVLLTFGPFLLGLFFPLFKVSVNKFLPDNSVNSVLSVERRSSLLLASYKMIYEKPLFGWGINSFTYTSAPFVIHREMILFTQPVHNVFVLLGVEVGLIGLMLFLSILVYTIFKTFQTGAYIYSVALIQIMLMSNFDHYFITTHQTLLLLILTLALGLTYTKDTDCL